MVGLGVITSLYTRYFPVTSSYVTTPWIECPFSMNSGHVKRLNSAFQNHDRWFIIAIIPQKFQDLAFIVTKYRALKVKTLKHFDRPWMKEFVKLVCVHRYKLHQFHFWSGFEFLLSPNNREIHTYTRCTTV